jgi:hypothetical protein
MVLKPVRPRIANVIPLTTSFTAVFTDVCLAHELQKPLTADPGVRRVTPR